MPTSLRYREKVFGLGKAVPLDRNAKVRVAAYAQAWSARQRQPRQHRGPITRAFTEVLEALLWGFHNSRDGRCFPSYERIAQKAGCARSTVYEAIRVLELAGVLTWQNRIARIRERTRDLFGRNGTRWRVIRTSNAYAFRDPKAGSGAPVSSKSESQPGTLCQEFQLLTLPPPVSTAPDSSLEQALRRLRDTVEDRLLENKKGAVIPAT